MQEAAISERHTRMEEPLPCQCASELSLKPFFKQGKRKEKAVVQERGTKVKSQSSLDGEQIHY